MLSDTLFQRPIRGRQHFDVNLKSKEEKVSGKKKEWGFFSRFVIKKICTLFLPGQNVHGVYYISGIYMDLNMNNLKEFKHFYRFQ